MEKKKIIKTIFHEIDYKRPIPFRKYKHLIEDDDVIYGGHEEEHWSENNGNNAHYFLTVKRNVLETDEEVSKRVKENNELKERFRKKRYEIYLELKEEYENYFEPNRTTTLKAKIEEWDNLAKDNKNNKHNLSTSERQDWIDELKDIADGN